jgi:hypothetical protein
MRVRTNLTREERKQRANLIAAVVFWVLVLVVCVVVGVVR